MAKLCVFVLLLIGAVAAYERELDTPEFIGGRSRQVVASPRQRVRWDTPVRTVEEGTLDQVAGERARVSRMPEAMPQQQQQPMMMRDGATMESIQAAQQQLRFRDRSLAQNGYTSTSNRIVNNMPARRAINANSGTIVTNSIGGGPHIKFAEQPFIFKATPPSAPAQAPQTAPNAANQPAPQQNAQVPVPQTPIVPQQPLPQAPAAASFPAPVAPVAPAAPATVAAAAPVSANPLSNLFFEGAEKKVNIAISDTGYMECSCKYKPKYIVLTDKGEQCQFPFQFEGITYYECTRNHRDFDWCSLDPVYQGRWGRCMQVRADLPDAHLEPYTHPKDIVKMPVPMPGPMPVPSPDVVQSALQQKLFEGSANSAPAAIQKPSQ